jgi:Carboxypeptidase regulatory-like domain
VLDASAFPLAGATITLRGSATRVIQSDPKGQFDFQSLPEGDYELTAALDGFAPVRQTARLRSGEKLIITVRLTLLIMHSPRSRGPAVPGGTGFRSASIWLGVCSASEVRASSKTGMILGHQHVGTRRALGDDAVRGAVAMAPTAKGVSWAPIGGARLAGQEK